MKFYSLLLMFVVLLSGCKKENDNHESIDLANTRWAINDSKEIPLSQDKNSRLPIILFGENDFRITTDCNGINGLIKISNKELLFKDYQSTLMHCEGKGEMEIYLMQNLRNISSYKYSEGILYLYIGKKMMGSFKRIENI